MKRRVSFAIDWGSPPWLKLTCSSPLCSLFTQRAPIQQDQTAFQRQTIYDTYEHKVILRLTELRIPIIPIFAAIFLRRAEDGYRGQGLGRQRREVEMGMEGRKARTESVC